MVSFWFYNPQSSASVLDTDGVRIVMNNAGTVSMSYYDVFEGYNSHFFNTDGWEYKEYRLPKDFFVNNMVIGIEGFTGSNSDNTTDVCIDDLKIDIYNKDTTTPSYTYSGGAWGGSNTGIQDITFAADGNLGDFLTNNLTIQSGVTVTVNSGYTLKVLGVIDGEGELVLENGASLLQVYHDNPDTGVGNSIANTRVKRTSQNMKPFDYTYWGSPVLVTDLATVSPDSDLYYIFSPSSNSWILADDTTPMFPTIGYLIQAPNGASYSTGTPQLVEFTGLPMNSPLTHGEGFADFTAGSNNLIANPYPSAFDLVTFYDQNYTALTPNFYFWTHNTNVSAGGNFSGNDYALYNAYLQTGTAATSGGSAPTRYVGVGQGFFAEGKAALPVYFRNSQRVSGNNSQFFKTTNTTTENSNSEKIWLNITNAEGAFKQALIAYTLGASNGYDFIDATTFDGNDIIDLYSIAGDKKLTLNARSMPFENTDVVPLGYKSYWAGNYQISIDHTDAIWDERNIYLKDNLLNVVHNLKLSAYTFAAEIGTVNDRFEIIYQPSTLQNSSVDANDGIVAYKNQDAIIITSQNSDITGVKVFDIQGRLLVEKNQLQTAETQVIPSATEQVVLVQVYLANGTKATKKILM